MMRAIMTLEEITSTAPQLARVRVRSSSVRSRATITVALWRGIFARWRDASEAHIRMDL